jgi:hypothetical protein
MKRIVKELFILDKSQWMDDTCGVGIVHTKTDKYYFVMIKNVNLICKVYEPTHIMLTKHTLSLFDSAMNLCFDKQEINEISFIKCVELLLNGVDKLHRIK